MADMANKCNEKHEKKLDATPSQRQKRILGQSISCPDDFSPNLKRTCTQLPEKKVDSTVAPSAVEPGSHAEAIAVETNSKEAEQPHEPTAHRVPYCDSSMSVIEQEFDQLMGNMSVDQFIDHELAAERDAGKFAEVLQKTARAARAKEEQRSSQSPAGSESVVTDEVLQKAAESGKFGMRDKVGQAWAKFIDADKNPEGYKSYHAKTMPEKKEARKLWAMEEYSHCKATKSHERSYKHVDTRKGKMYTYGDLVISYGGWDWPPAIRAAKRHALRCSVLGGEWIQADSEFSGLLHFLKMEVEFVKIHEKAWKQCTEWHNGDASVRVDKDDDDDDDDGGGGGGGVGSNSGGGGGGSGTDDTSRGAGGGVASRKRERKGQRRKLQRKLERRRKLHRNMVEKSCVTRSMLQQR